MNDENSPDLAPITRYLRAMYRSRLLVAAVKHLRVFEQFGDQPLSLADLQTKLGLADRPTMVLVPALCAMQLIEIDDSQYLTLTEQGHHLKSSTHPNLTEYVGLEGDDPGCVEMAQRLRNDGPSDQSGGTAYVKEGAEPSPMDDPELARMLTLALSGRAALLSPIVAKSLPGGSGHLLDVAGGSGLFTYEWLLANPDATATVFDRPHVLTVAAEFLDSFCKSDRRGAAGVRNRVQLTPCDMLSDPLPDADLILAASLFHDWPTPTCELLAKRFASALKPGGEIWIHDAFMNDRLDGPLEVIDYSAQLFWFTKGRIYSRREYRSWLAQAGLQPTSVEAATQMDYGLISATK